MELVQKMKPSAATWGVGLTCLNNMKNKFSTYSCFICNLMISGTSPLCGGKRVMLPTSRQGIHNTLERRWSSRSSYCHLDNWAHYSSHITCTMYWDRPVLVSQNLLTSFCSSKHRTIFTAASWPAPTQRSESSDIDSNLQKKILYDHQCRGTCSELTA